MTKILSVLVTLAILTSSVFGAEIEDWYIKAGLGFTDITYPSPLEDAVNTLESHPAVDRTTVALDFGVYWPIENQLLLGFNINGTGDRLSDAYDHIQINLYNYAFSAIYNFNEIRDGFYVRGDIGIARAVVDSSFGSTVSSDSGLGLGLGAGYAFSFDTWGIMPELLLTKLDIENSTTTTTQFLINFMW